MKKVFLVVIVVYLAIGGLIVCLSGERKNEINYFTLPMNYSRLMTEDEEIVVNLFIDDDRSFFTEISNITNAYIHTEKEEIAVTISGIDEKDSGYLFQGNQYYLFGLTLTFDKVSISGFDLSYQDCYLRILYINEEEIDLEIGDMFLEFKEVVYSNYIGFENLYGITNIVNEKEYLVGLCIKINDYTNSQIELTDINTNNLNIILDFGKAKYFENKPDSNSDILELIPDYELFDATNKSNLKIKNDYYLIIPIVYEIELSKNYRFPITIEYLYQGTQLDYLIDDCIFFNESVELDEYASKIRTYNYQYK
ncbi:MAG: hypothetical protein RBR50_04545 [Candidatus Izemoplasmatales bacterium]|nr:hypothetical protein [Candidatus Izemoplasmatales bacterium]